MRSPAFPCKTPTFSLLSIGAMRPMRCVVVVAPSVSERGLGALSS